MQKWIAVGRLTANPQLSYGGGVAKCTFTLAVESRTGNYKKTDFVPIVAWRQLGENAAQYLVAGQRIGIEGKLRVSPYEQNGKKQNSFEIEADEIEYYDAPRGK